MELIFLLIVVVFLCGVIMYNSIVHAQLKVEEARSGIDVALSKRYAILTNMQESVKGYVKHEREVLSKLTEIRKTMTLQELNEANAQMNHVQSKLMAIAESYPELKASSLFSEFNAAIVDCEEHLQAARRFYNSNVTLYNEKLVMFPTSILANVMNKERADFFESTAEERKNTSVQF